MRLHHVCCGILSLLAPIVASAQGSPWTVVRFPSETPVVVSLVGVNQPRGAGKEDKNGSSRPSGPSGPSGFANITRGETSTNIVLNVGGLPAGTHYVYLINVNGSARKLGTIEHRGKYEYNKPPEETEAFMIIVSTDGNLRTLPARNRIELYSVAPRNLQV